MNRGISKLMWMHSAMRKFVLLHTHIANGWRNVELPENRPIVSIYVGQTWDAYRPGEDKIFPRHFVSRKPDGGMGSVLHSMEELVANAIHLGVTLRWRPQA